MTSRMLVRKYVWVRSVKPQSDEEEQTLAWEILKSQELFVAAP